MDTGSAASVDALTESLKRAVSALEAQGVPYLLGGGLGCWARGGPPSSNDIDLMLEPAEAERALEALRPLACGPKGRRSSGSSRPGTTRS